MQHEKVQDSSFIFFNGVCHLMRITTFTSPMFSNHKWSDFFVAIICVVWEFSHNNLGNLFSNQQFSGPYIQTKACSTHVLHERKHAQEVQFKNLLVTQFLMLQASLRLEALSGPRTLVVFCSLPYHLLLMGLLSPWMSWETVFDFLLWTHSFGHSQNLWWMASKYHHFWHSACSEMSQKGALLILARHHEDMTGDLHELCALALAPSSAVADKPVITRSFWA